MGLGRYVRCWLVILAMAYWVTSARGGTCTMARVSQLPLQAHGAHALVGISLNGKPATLIFDTGAFTSLLSEAAVDRLGLTRMQGEEVRQTFGSVEGIGGARSARFVTAHTVEIGGLHARDYNFMAAKMQEEWTDGLLSADLISQFDIDLDFAEAKIILFRPNGDCSAPAAFLAGPLYSAPMKPVGDDRRPRIEIAMNNQVLTALIDTGAPRTAIFRSAARRLGIALPVSGTTSVETVSGIGPSRVAIARYVVPSFTVGDLAFGHVPVLVLDDAQESGVDMLLGADFQSSVHLWISYSSHTVIMQYPPKPSKSLASQ